jgi:hypothetical protein
VSRVHSVKVKDVSTVGRLRVVNYLYLSIVIIPQGGSVQHDCL